MWQEFLDLFSGSGLIPMIILFVGLLFCMLEIIIPGFGVFGIIGVIFSVGGVVARIIMVISWMQVLILFILVVAVATISVLLISLFAKMGLLGKISLVQNKTAIPVDYEKPTKEQKKLIGKVGFAETDFKTSGKFKLNGNIYEAMSTGEFIDKGEKVKVVEIKNNTIIVKKL